jgi:release factor glutamine methyltransferase
MMLIVTDGYTPTVSADEAARMRRWHEDAYRRGKVDTEQTFDYLGQTIVVPPDVQPINPMSDLLGRAVLAEAGPTDRVLDMGTGSGVNAILAASTGATVVAVDINPYAVEAARRNAAANGVADRVDVRASDVFSDVDGRFDLIVFDPPFRWFAPRDQFEMAMADENYRALTAFFRQVRAHLTERGRMLIFFGTSGDLGYLTRLAVEERFRSEIVARRELVKDDWRVEYLTYRMVPEAV